VVKQGNRLQILEAIGPVKFTPIKEWIGQGYNSQYTQMRLQPVLLSAIQPAIREAKKLLGAPYDLQYQLDEEKIYCSELIYKAFKRGASLELGKIEQLKDLNWVPHTPFIIYLAGGSLPLKRKMVTPESMFRDDDLYVLYSNVPGTEIRNTKEIHKMPVAKRAVKKKKENFSKHDLEGRWAGDYTIKSFDTVNFDITLKRNGRLKSGAIHWSAEKKIGIVEFQVTDFNKTGVFKAQLVDARGVQARVLAKIAQGETGILGHWKDQLGHQGIFSLKKVN